MENEPTMELESELFYEASLFGIFLHFSFIFVDEYIVFFWVMFGSGKFEEKCEGNKIEREN